VRSAAHPLLFQSLAFSATPSGSRSPSFKGDIFSLQLRGDIILEHLQPARQWLTVLCARCSIWKISDAPFIHQPGFRPQHGYVLLYVYVYTRAAGAEQFFLDFRLRLETGAAQSERPFCFGFSHGTSGASRERGRHVKVEEANRHLL
ncbi:MAG TPA: hypothetical protein VN658_08930, partial [Candidatus Acidoferrales bacterium]|nr:hypothetical protein [Candidatus Acidoferrales bacterium]